MAKIVFEKLTAKNCDFSKMVSITTDGAKNMIGQYSGMANEIVKIVNEKMARPGGLGLMSILCGASTTG